ncbi:hypothetical protein MO867_18845 [Microbulbifer sp. OS29]|uniref:Holin of 3TMs, for gene-transfer release n=1 Tax=Microbulbifer okhotskensis TaxID=2926617 RepID=A0A9X2ES55_9GAMM|nr:hypothetical protein [Microbulbifer okhotskensis]MCO1336395.1 hypothetical protein [Microbulbifer okhotskensis]
MSISASVVLAGVKFIFGGLVDLVKHKRQVKAEEQRGELEVKRARNNAEIKRALNGDEHAAAMDFKSADQRGWKDDYLLILTTLPMVLLFVAPLLELVIASSYQLGELQAAVNAGFRSLQATPEYYWWGLAAVYIDTFGFRRMLRQVIEGWAAKRLSSVRER